MIRHCEECLKIIWPWQKLAWHAGYLRVLWYHRACWIKMRDQLPPPL